MKEAIMKAAEKLFAEKGFAATSMDEVAAAAGVSKGSLYNYFANKSQLFGETVISGIKYFQRKADEIVQNAYSVRPAASQFVRLFVGIYSDNRVMADMVMQSFTDGIDAGVVDSIKEAKARLISGISGAISMGISEGAIRPCNTSAVAEGMINYIYGYCAAAFRSPMADKNKVAAEVELLLLSGMMR